MSRRFRTRTVTNIFYATLLTCLIEIFLIANVSMVEEYLRKIESCFKATVKNFYTRFRNRGKGRFIMTDGSDRKINGWIT